MHAPNSGPPVLEGGRSASAHVGKARWWTVALSEELDDGVLLAVCCDGSEYVLFRDSAGEARALRDQCAHRRAPLSLGRRTPEGYVECPYHGWRYEGRTGHCVAIPNFSADERVPRTYRTQSYGVIERDGFIHVWSGDPTTAEPLEFPISSPLAGPHTWRGAQLVILPHQYLADLLIDAPGVVLAIRGVEVFNDHRYGDPVVRNGCVVATYAADRAASVRSRKKAVSDYPFALEVAVTLDGRMAELQLRNDAEELLATLIVTVYPDRPPLTSARWRGSARASTGDGSSIGMRAHVNAQLVKATRPVASPLLHRSPVC